jgi:hypothetical protein
MTDVSKHAVDFPDLTLTGKINILIDVENYGPIEFYGNNIALATEILVLIVNNANISKIQQTEDGIDRIYTNAMEKIR